ncbi:hypothetical protein DPMN_045646 [Dreissena polymorpha]|uniref:Uncharacterized protein n=1 Tax=Dreissena polymorpha TaxID=45954 RepID=A0A9D4D6F1_DREPO|nr:hypothetical protein DPMN_045646 [Dreissena polymorpha]
MRNMEGRFGAKELQDTSRVKFQQAEQITGESLEDWADRMLTFVTLAFRNLPQKHNMQEAISKFCQDDSVYQEAETHACIKRPRLI